MSLRQALRARFRSPEKSQSKDSQSGSTEELAPSASSSSTSWKTLEEEDRNSVHSQNESDERDDSPHRSSDEHVYEIQLNQLQVVAAMIENQSLATELESCQNKEEVSKLQHDLEFERERSQHLVLQLQEARAEQHKPRKRPDEVDLAHEATEDLSAPSAVAPVQEAPARPKTFMQKLNEWLLSTLYELAEDFSDIPEAETEEEEDPLAVKKLKDNIKRFKEGTTPIYRTIRGVTGIFAWKYPAFSLIVLLLYMYSVWRGWLLPVFLFVLIQRLFINYLRHRGFDINIRLFTEVEEESDKESESLKGVSDKFNLVLQVAKQVQNKLGHLSDGLEKLKNLFLWKQPEATGQLFTVLCVAFVLSCILPGTTLFTIVGLYMGFKMFVIEYIHMRYPRFKQRHDTVYKIWQTLPTDSQLSKRNQRAQIDRQILSVESPSLEASSLSSTPDLSKHDKTFCEKYSLPLAERPLRGWRGGRRCTIINKDKPLMSSFKHGKMYLTRSFLCFELAKPSSSVKDLVMPLSDITKVKKAKPYSWMPGAGMSIEITVIGSDKPYLFGALLTRDDSYDQIMAHAAKANLPWAIPPTDGDSDSVFSHQGAAGEEENLSLADQPLRMSSLKEDEDLLGLMNEF